VKHFSSHLSDQTSKFSNCKIKLYIPQADVGNNTAAKLLGTADAVLNCLRPQSGRTSYVSLRE